MAETDWMTLQELGAELAVAARRASESANGANASMATSVIRLEADVVPNFMTAAARFALAVAGTDTEQDPGRVLRALFEWVPGSPWTLELGPPPPDRGEA